MLRTFPGIPKATSIGIIIPYKAYDKVLPIDLSRSAGFSTPSEVDNVCVVVLCKSAETIKIIIIVYNNNCNNKMSVIHR